MTQPVTRPGGPDSRPSADRWRDTRRGLHARRHELTAVAGALYPDCPRAGPTGLLCDPSWLPAAPLDLASVTLWWRPDPPPPGLTGTEPAAAAVLPAGFACYSAALAALDPPAIFENRVTYRLLDLTVGPGGAAMTFGPGRYFDGVDVGEAVSHELAAAPAGARLAALPLRAAAGHPADLAARPAQPAISVLTLRYDRSAGRATFLLHWRDPARVTHAGGLYQVVPVGVFQPSADGPAALGHDLDLWRCIVRELSEELLGGSEDYGDGCAPFDYAGWPLHQALSLARAAGRLGAYYLGAGVDPLSLATDLLAAVVIDAEVFDDVFAGLVDRNSEGIVVSGGDARGFPFDEPTVSRLVREEPLQAAGAAALALAWQHRAGLLGGRPG